MPISARGMNVLSCKTKFLALLENAEYVMKILGGYEHHVIYNIFSLYIDVSCI